MTRDSHIEKALRLMRDETAVVVPVCVPEGMDREAAAAGIHGNVMLLREQVADPSHICLSVDGEDCGADIAEGLSREFGAALAVRPERGGKLRAIVNGLRTVNASWTPRYMAVVDQDGDHFGNELLNFVRAAEDIVRQTGADHVLVLGRRISRHRPMGFLRGELEELADRVLLDALAYHAAQTGQPLRMEYAFLYEEFPDFHSGYKLFSRAVAEHVFLGEPNLAGVPEDCYYRHAIEAVMTVEALAFGAYLGVVNRSALNEQPVSCFGMIDRERFVADKMIWPCKRLEVPAGFVKQWLDNHIPRVLLRTLTPDGRDELLRIRNLVLSAWDEPGADAVGIEPAFV